MGIAKEVLVHVFHGGEHHVHKGMGDAKFSSGEALAAPTSKPL